MQWGRDFFSKAREKLISQLPSNTIPPSPNGNDVPFRLLKLEMTFLVTVSAKIVISCTSQAKVDTQTRKYTPKLFGRAFDIVLESDNSMRTQDVLRCRT